MKHSKLIVFLSLLLVAVMAFSSCSGSANLPDGEKQLVIAPNEDNVIDLMSGSASDTGVSAEAAVSANKANMAAAIKEWQKYVSYKQNDLKANEVKIAAEIVNAYDNVEISYNYDAIIVVEAEKWLWNPATGNNDVETKRTLVYNLYSADVTKPVFDSGDYKADGTTVYSVEIYNDFAGFSVEKTVTVLVIDDTDPENPVITDTKYEYETSLYTTALIANAKTQLSELDFYSYYVPTSDGYYVEVVLEGKIYCIDSCGNVLKIFAEGLEYTLPGAPDYKNGGLNYYVYEGSYISVLDAGFAPVSYYAYLAEYEDVATYLLPNGNVFVQYEIRLEKDAKNFDYIYNGAKYDLVQHVYDVKSGKVSELNLGYYVSYLYTEEVEDMFAINNAEHFFVRAFAYDKGETISTANTQNIVLKGNFETVKVLPNIIENQYGLPKFVSMNRVIVETYFASSHFANTLVAADGSYWLLPAEAWFDGTSFWFDGTEYVYENTVGCDFVNPFKDSNYYYEFNGGTSFIISCTETDAEGVSKNYFKLYYYNASTASYKTVKINGDDVAATVGSLVCIENDGAYVWYDAMGNRVATSEYPSWSYVAGGYMIKTVESGNTKYYFVK